jgi:bifunctional DNase/RNase
MPEMKRLDVVGLHVEATSGAPLVVLRERDAPRRVLPIFIGGAEAASIAIALAGEAPPRPLSHDLMAALVKSLGARVKAVEITALQNGAFFAELAVSGPDGERRLDARPSDSIALAVRLDAPLYAGEDVLSEAGGELVDQPDEEAIDRAVAEFRTYLEGLDPAALSAALDMPPGPAIEAGEPTVDDDEETPSPARIGMTTTEPSPAAQRRTT